MSTVKDRLIGFEFTWSKFLKEPSTWGQKEKEFTELRMTGSMTVMQNASKFIELSRFVPKFIASEG